MIRCFALEFSHRGVISPVSLLDIFIRRRLPRVLRLFSSNSEASVIGDGYGARRVNTGFTRSPSPPFDFDSSGVEESGRFEIVGSVRPCGKRDSRKTEPIEFPSKIIEKRKRAFVGACSSFCQDSRGKISVETSSRRLGFATRLCFCLETSLGKAG